MSATAPTAIDLFAGAGGFSLAAKRVGFSVLAAIENNKHAAATYKKNFITGQEKAPKLYDSNIFDVDIPKLLKDVLLQPGQCDLVMGGPPCQGFSEHRFKDDGVDDPRNRLLLRYFSVVNIVRPKAFILENVPGLLWSRHSAYLAEFQRLADEAGYFVHPPVLLNARDFGVPQNRRRVFILGVRDDTEMEISWPPSATHFAPASLEVTSQKLPAWIAASSVFGAPPPGDTNSNHMQHSKGLIEVFKKTPPNGGSRHQSGRILPCHKKHDGHKDVYGRINPTVPGPTMTTACINPSKGRFVHPTEHHGITVRQAARFQSFPDDFIFEGGLIASGMQIGNAVPISLGEAVLSPIYKSVITLNSAQPKVA